MNAEGRLDESTCYVNKHTHSRNLTGDYQT